MTGKEFRKALKEQFKRLNLDDKEIHVSDIGHFMWVSEGSLIKQITDIAESDKMLEFIDNGCKLESKDYIFYLKDGDDASTMYVTVEQKI